MPQPPRKMYGQACWPADGLPPVVACAIGRSQSSFCLPPPAAPLPHPEQPAPHIPRATAFPDPAEAIDGARHIVAEMISESADFRKALRQMMFDEGVIVSRKVEDTPGEAPKDPQEKFKMYYDYREPAAKIPSHRMLA